ncbi:uncharacterized protein at1g03900 [Phtheirospermum japonicum]|uniref:Uncharacterized protein at1g03900 n=1 Tax=Phtheirospermum japonicum TaxID=374723 RepID=A0A830D3P8_9LAMI|nr:uncharacterized protein at1g03900 [Phtheirospermum japonicum]
MSYEEDGQETFEHTLLVVREVFVYKIPPRPTSGGYKCGEWLQSDRIWSGRVRVVSCGTRCEIRLEDPNSGELFAACFVNPGQREVAVESVLDSSRYFVLRIEDGRGKHAFVGLGFNERNEAFDFNVALSDHEKHVKREVEKEVGSAGGAADEGRKYSKIFCILRNQWRLHLHQNLTFPHRLQNPTQPTTNPRLPSQSTAYNSPARRRHIIGAPS